MVFVVFDLGDLHILINISHNFITMSHFFPLPFLCCQPFFYKSDSLLNLMYRTVTFLIVVLVGKTESTRLLRNAKRLAGTDGHL